MGIFLTFLGANATVTGSKTMVEAPGGRFLVDCGMFQGPHEIREHNWEPFPVPPGDIAAVLLTHAHLDHCGYLPALVRDGFTGPIHCTPNTAALASIVLRDSAKLQEEDTTFARRKGFSRHTSPRALYEMDDAESAIAQFAPVSFRTEFHPVPGITATFEPAGHILGSSTVVITDGTKSVVFSGDLGRNSHPLLRPPSPPTDADAIVVESTYGNRTHEDVDQALEQMAQAITRTIKRGGTVVIPAFAVDRTEVLLKALHDLQDTNRIPKVPIHVDSPMALAAMRVYRDAIADGDPEICSAAIAQGVDIISPANLFESKTPDESKRLDLGGARIIISASGMGTGGRVIHHLKALLPDRDNTVILAGFQAVGTPGRALIDGAEEMKFHGKYVRVRAEILNVEGFSVHADAQELLHWLQSSGGNPEQIFVNHGEPEASAALARRICEEMDIVAVVPAFGERVAI
jgi:metallo-beta-lactamase family protein